MTVDPITLEVVTLRVRAEGPRPEVPLPRWTGGGPVADAQVATRRLVLDGAPRDVAVLARDRLAAGEAFDGPAVVTGLESTVWVAAWQRGRVDEVGALHLEARP